MAVLKPAEIDGFIARPDDRFVIVLIYGPDDGLVTERGARLVKTLAGGSDDPFSLVRLDGATVTQDPARLIDEASTISMFGGRRVIALRDGGGRTNILPAVTPLLDRPPSGSVVVIEAGDLKKGAGLRKKVEDHPRALALPCYTDGAAEIARVIAEETALAGLAIDRDARETLERLLGADRMATRGEVRKLCLYAHGTGRITLADVTAIVGDTSGLEVDDLVDAVAGGDLDTADRVFARLTLAGTHASVVAGAVMRHFHLLQRLRARIEVGASPSQAVDDAQPPIFFRRKSTIAAQLGLWNGQRLNRALALLDDALLASRQRPALADAAVSDALLQLARAARASRRTK